MKWIDIHAHAGRLLQQFAHAVQADISARFKVYRFGMTVKDWYPDSSGIDHHIPVSEDFLRLPEHLHFLA